MMKMVSSSEKPCLPSSTRKESIYLSPSPPTSVTKEPCLTHLSLFPYLWCSSDFGTINREAAPMMQHGDHADSLPDVDLYGILASMY